MHVLIVVVFLACVPTPSQRVGSRYLEVSFSTTDVDTWCYLECYLVLPGHWLGFRFGVGLFCDPKISAFLKLKLVEKNQFPPGDVTWAHACSRYLFTWPTL